MKGLYKGQKVRIPKYVSNAPLENNEDEIKVYQDGHHYGFISGVLTGTPYGTLYHVKFNDGFQLCYSANELALAKKFSDNK